MNWYMDAITPEELLAINKTDLNTYNLHVRASYDTIGHSYHLRVHMINSNHQVAIWEKNPGTRDHRYQLYVSKGYASHFDLVVSECNEQAVDDFQFDGIDYAALLKKGLN